VLHSIQSTFTDALPPTMTVDDAAAFLGISRSSAYTLSARYRETEGSEGLPNVRLGGRVLVLTAPLLELVRASTPGATAGAGSVGPSATAYALFPTPPDAA
jgi:transposase